MVSFKDIQIAYLIEGMDGVERLLKGRKNIASLLRRAVKELRAAGKKTDTLDKYIAENYGPGTRGRSVPMTGQERLYKAQRIHAGGPFLRLPLAPLGTDKGGVVRVCFERDQIIVRNAA
ncbi:MAG: hypothetical protein JKY15_04500 [Deltaproteobacteria bacterium]|nr:hypothetical protein [Deltaproteobacteria bacterium]